MRTCRSAFGLSAKGMRRFHVSRSLPLWMVLPLAACSGAQEPPAAAQGGETIACALAGSDAMKPVCAVERDKTGTGLVLVVHHPDGGFRRFDVETDGSGLKPSDGADRAVTRLEGDQLEVRVGTDRYLFPVTVKALNPRNAKS